MTLNRIVVLLTPIFAGLAGTFTSWAAQNLPGSPQLDSAELTALFVAGAATGLAAVWKWLQGWQGYEARQWELELYARTTGPGQTAPEE